MPATIFLVAIIFIGATCAQTGDNAKSLVTDLFTANNYQKKVRPVRNQDDLLVLRVDFHLIGINGVDEASQRLTTTGYLSTLWKDQYLEWDPTSYGGMISVNVPQSYVWKPALALQNGFTKLQELGSSVINVNINISGHVTWEPYEVFESKCNIDVKYFPFDHQTCNISFIDWSYQSYEVQIQEGTYGIVTGELEDDAVWTVISTKLYHDTLDLESRLTYSLTIKRTPGFHVLNIIVPVILLGVLNLFTFVLPADSGEKMGYSITVFLSFAVFLIIVNSELPKTTGSIFGQYLIFQLGIALFTVCVTAIQLRFHYRTDPVPRLLSAVLGCRCKSKRKITDGNENGKLEKDTNESKLEETWNDFISILDFILFWVSFFVVLSVTIVVFLKLS
ncbi:acetylcholine receptor subunit alpha-like [Mytilus trossulus]|uniref:acetylcholine receptor subunit alpha-like n=1 Tax=Mytilus trossulus TaxID=6551 RepID=UPI003007C1B7